MNRHRTTDLAGIVALALWSLLSLGQQVQVSQNKGDVVLSVKAQKAYQILIGEEKLPVLMVECAQKGKKSAHLVKFSPGGTLREDSVDAPSKGENLDFDVTIGGTKQTTTWAPYGDGITFVYAGKTEAERIAFIESFMDSKTVSIEFKPFLTGVATTSVFDVSQLHAEMSKHPECTLASVGVYSGPSPNK
jgi:hypothetical protein